MSTQDILSIPFKIEHDQQNFRLIELPPSLLARITSRYPPTLYLKSEPPNASSTNVSTGNAFICTDNQTYEVRQVQSSNTLYILKPSADNDLTESSVSVIGECKALLELAEVSTAAAAFLKRNVPVYDGSASEPPSRPTGNGINREALLADAPFSETEFNAAWTNMCMFESNNQAWRPSTVVMHNFWLSFMTAASLKKVNLESIFQLFEVAGMLKEDGFSNEIAGAIFPRLGILWPGHEPHDPRAVTLEREKCVPWLGAILLELSTLVGPIAVPDFMAKWRDELPETWRGDANLECLQGLFSMVENDQVQFIGDGTTPKEQAEPVPAVKNAKGPNKWHDRFKSTR